jgi:hypothetical protein
MHATDMRSRLDWRQAGARASAALALQTFDFRQTRPIAAAACSQCMVFPSCRDSGTTGMTDFLRARPRPAARGIFA